jgi:hypothetical protein
MYDDNLQNYVFIFFPQLDFFLILVVSKTLLSLRFLCVWNTYNFVYCNVTTSSD